MGLGGSPPFPLTPPDPPVFLLSPRGPPQRPQRSRRCLQNAVCGQSGECWGERNGVPPNFGGLQPIFGVHRGPWGSPHNLWGPSRLWGFPNLFNFGFCPPTRKSPLNPWRSVVLPPNFLGFPSIFGIFSWSFWVFPTFGLPPNIPGSPQFLGTPLSLGSPLLVSPQNYDTTESKLRREFEVYGPIKRVSGGVNPQKHLPDSPCCPGVSHLSPSLNFGVSPHTC